MPNQLRDNLAGFFKEKPLIAVASILMVMALGAYLFMYGPLINKLRKTHRECKRLETEVIWIREAAGTLKMGDTKYRPAASEDFSSGIDELTRKGRLEGINFTSITPKDIQERGKGQYYKVVPIEIEMESTYEALGIFLGSLDKLKSSVFTVGKFNIAHADEGAQKLKAKLLVNMYLLNQSEK